MLSSAPSALSTEAVLSLLSALPLPSPGAEELVSVHRPFERPSTLPTSAVTKILTRLNSSVASRDPEACALAALIISQDEEGHAAAQCGKTWMGACLGALSVQATSAASIPSFLELTVALVAAAPQAPSFEREVIQPAMGKLAVSMGRLVERMTESGEWDALLAVLAATRSILLASPAPFRPAAPTIRTPLMAIVLRLSLNDAQLNTPEDVRLDAAATLAVLHFTGGKAAAPAAWGAEMREALGGIAASISALTADAWEEETPRTAPFPPPATLPSFPIDPLARVAAALDALEGYTELALAFLRLSTSRPVPVPISQLVSCALRTLSLTLDSPVAAHISPQHHAALISSLPRVWTCGILILAQTVTVCEDHLVPHLSPILEHSVFLLERLPVAMAQPRLQLLRFHSILLDAYPSAVLPVEYTTRILRFSLGVLGPLLEDAPRTAAVSVGRKGKKRARGAEDALVSGLEGRAGRPISQAESDSVLAALQLTPHLHSAPLQPALITFSIRLHLSLYLALPLRSFADKSAPGTITAALTSALEQAATLSIAGTALDTRTLILSLVPTVARSSTFDLMLHPVLPPLARPMPSLAQLQLWAPESEEERKVRKEMGYAVDEEEDEDEEQMQVDEVAVQAPLRSTSLFAPAPVVSVPAPALAPPTTHTFAPAPPAPAPPATAEAVPPPAAPPAPMAESAAPLAATQGMPFMSTPAASAPAASAPPPLEPTAAPAGDDDDEPIPELDSGSSDDEMDDDEE